VTPTPEEPLEEGPERDFSGGAADGSEAALRGWIDPDDRLWRHPSELAAAATATTRTAGIRPTSARHPRMMLLIGAAATLAAVAWAIVLISPASDQPGSLPANDTTADVPLTTLAVPSASVPPAAEAAGHSMVELQADTTHGTVSLVGVAVAEGGLVATTADDLSGLHALYMVGPDGHRLRAQLMATDDASDVALVSVPDDVPVAPFADDASLDQGSPDMTLSLTTPGTRSLAVSCQDGSVMAVGAEIGSGWAKGMPDITSSEPAGHQEPGDPLLNPAGEVIGLLYGSGPSPTFLPSQLVLGVADDLRSTGRVSHGWLGVRGFTAPGSGGAGVSSLMTGSPALGLLHPGEVVVGMDSVPIRSMADLRARLYVMAPDTTVGLSVLDGTATTVVDVTLSASP
jgi:S1-C subfamily serine protease